MRFTYLLLNAFTISIPLFRSFEPRINFFSKWKYFVPANIITSIFFLVWDYFKTAYGVWQFNDQYIIGIKFFGLPIEEFLFFITVPYACTFIYETILLFVKRRLLADSVKGTFTIISIIGFILSFFLFEKAYTFSVLFIGGAMFLVASLLLSAERFEKFLITYSISIIPMLFVNGLLTGLPVVIYNNAENIGFRIGTIPVEDFLYGAMLLLMNIGLYEWQKNKAGISVQKIPA
ncbi:MAG: lycopene cyclase domain-containing protein [Chitinophagales bacterium]|nr:lycopene cyclase domain-containing protein [Chitinophagales bacterium]